MTTIYFVSFAVISNFISILYYINKIFFKQNILYALFPK